MNPDTPPHSEAFGPAEDADATRQSQHTVSNDAPTDVNINAVLARTQGETAARRADQFNAAAARHETLSEAILARIAMTPAT